MLPLRGSLARGRGCPVCVRNARAKLRQLKGMLRLTAPYPALRVVNALAALAIKLKVFAQVAIVFRVIDKGEVVAAGSQVL